MTRQTGVTWRRLDLDDLVPFAQSAHIAGGGKWTTLTIGGVPMAATGVNGVLYVVCEEGVGCEVTNDDPLVLQFYGGRDADDGTAREMSFMPVMQGSLKPDEIMNRMGDEIDLSDLIRKFGSRLESNFRLWHQTLAVTIDTAPAVH